MPEVLPGNGGGGTASIIIYQHEYDMVIGGAQMQRTVEVGAESLPSHVFFKVRLAAHGYTRAVGQAYADGFGLLIEGLLVDPRVAGIDYMDDPNAAGRLIDYLLIFWTTPDGSATGRVDVPMGPATDATALAAVAAAMTPYL